MDTLLVHDDSTLFRARAAAEALHHATGRTCVVVQRRLPPHVDAVFRGSAMARAFLERQGIRVVQ